MWHTNSKYRRVVWQCNHKFDNEEKCTTPHLDEKSIKALFVKAVNILTTEKDEIAASFHAIKVRLFDTADLEVEQLRLDEVGNAITEKLAKKERIEMFLAELERQDGVATEFDENLWYSLVDFVTVFNKEDIRFTFIDGTEIKM